MAARGRPNARHSRSITLAVTVVAGLFGRVAAADPASTSPEQGYDLGEIQGARMLAFGGAQAALGTSTTSLFLNPANLPLARVYHFEALAAVSPEAQRQSYGGAVVDSSTSRLAGGVAGTWNLQDPNGINRQWTDIRVGMGYGLGDRFSVGAAGRYLRVSQATGSGPLGPSEASDGLPSSPILNTLTCDIGATLIPIDGFRIGAVGKNLTNPGTGLAPTTVQGGAGYGSELFSIETDVLGDFTTYSAARARVMFGGELFLGGHVPIRLGYRCDDGTKTQAISAGLGYIESSWSFEVSARHDFVGEHPSTMLVASVRFFYNPEGTGAGVEHHELGFLGRESYCATQKRMHRSSFGCRTARRGLSAPATRRARPPPASVLSQSRAATDRRPRRRGALRHGRSQVRR